MDKDSGYCGQGRQGGLSACSGATRLTAAGGDCVVRFGAPAMALRIASMLIPGSPRPTLKGIKAMKPVSFARDGFALQGTLFLMAPSSPLICPYGPFEP